LTNVKAAILIPYQYQFVWFLVNAANTKEKLSFPLRDMPINDSVFSLNFSSSGKGPFLTGKEKNIRQRRTFLGEEGSGVREMALPSLGKL